MGDKGTSKRGDVETTMNQPVAKTVSKSSRAGSTDAGAPFDANRAGGNGGSNIPTHVYEKLGTKGYGSGLGSVSQTLASPGQIVTDPKAPRRFKL